MAEEGAMEAKDLLLADLQHFGESMLRNEEVGEKRFDFFVTLVTAVVAGLVALATSTDPATKAMLKPIAHWALAALLVVGLLSFLRMLHRNRITDDYKRTLKLIRGKFKAGCAELREYEVPVKRETWSRKWLKGGYAETIGTMNGLLITALLYLRGSDLATAITLGVVFTVVLWVPACLRSE
jgi:hypothetical protein